MGTKRIVYKPKDLQVINGKSISTCRKEIRRMREHYGLGKAGYLTVDHVSEWTSVPVQKLMDLMNP